MRTLEFHRDIYSGEALDEALKVYERFADFEREERDDRYVVEVTAKKPELERRIAGELGNYALGLTLRSKGAR